MQPFFQSRITCSVGIQFGILSDSLLFVLVDTRLHLMVDELTEIGNIGSCDDLCRWDIADEPFDPRIGRYEVGLNLDDERFEI